MFGSGKLEMLLDKLFCCHLLDDIIRGGNITLTATNILNSDSVGIL